MDGVPCGISSGAPLIGAYEVAGLPEERSVLSARLRVEQRRWLAERYDRNQFGKPDSTMNVGVSIHDTWLASLKAVEAKYRAKREAEARTKAEQIPEADYEVVEDQEAD